MASVFRRSNGRYYILSTLPDDHRIWKPTGRTSHRDALKALGEFDFSPAPGKAVRKIPTLSEFTRLFLLRDQKNDAIGAFDPYGQATR